MKTTIWEMKTLLNEVNGRLDITEENISELEVKNKLSKMETQKIFKYTYIYRKTDREPEGGTQRQRQREEIKVSQIGKK